MSPLAEQVFAQCTYFYRDTVLSPEVLSLYRVGILFREPTFCDSTYRFGGFAAPHRYLIISANAKCIDEFSELPEWGLCLWQLDRIFKVIGIYRRDEKAQVTLLEIPEVFLAEFVTPELNEMEKRFAAQAGERFETALDMPPLAEHRSRSWLDRLRYPVGVAANGAWFEHWEYGA